MQPVRETDDELRFRITLLAEWGGQGPTTDNIEQLYGDIDAADNIEKYYEEEYRDRDPQEFLSSGYVDVHRGFEIEDADSIAWARITGDEIRYSVYGCDAVRDAYDQLAEWYDENADRPIREFATFPDFRAFQATGVQIEPTDGKSITVDPTKNDRRKHNEGPLVEVGKEPEGDRGIARVGRWDIDYRIEDNGEATVMFVHPEAHTVVLANEVGDVLGDFLELDRLLVASEDQLEELSEA